MNTRRLLKFTVPQKCQFEMALDESRLTQKMIAESHKLSGFYEDIYSLVVAALLRPGDAVVDVGAHVGYYTLLAASAVGPAGQVFAFEPAPDNVQYLQENIRHNSFKNINVSPCVVGQDQGSATLYYDSDNDGGHAVWDVSLAHGRVKCREDSKFIRVPRISLDARFADDPDIHFRLLKIDAEGSELEVMKGASNLMTRGGVDCIMWERNDETFSYMGFTEHDVRETAAHMGYDTCGFVAGRLRRIPFGTVLSPGERINLFSFSPQFSMEYDVIA